MDPTFNISCFEVGDAAVIVHGGAGGWDREKAKEAIEAVGRAAERGLETLKALRDPLDAVAAAVRSMEDSGVLNAGRGSVLTLNGLVEMDAGVMSSEGLVGAVAAVRRVANPILAALIVARETPHVLLAGPGAERLAEAFGVGRHPGPLPERVAAAHRRLERDRWRLLYRLWREKTTLYSACDTVGAVAVYRGVLAAGTSTGGLSFKLEGRVGDSPIPGAGFYATREAACSATGIGEAIIADMVCLHVARAVEGRRLEASIAETLSRFHARHPTASLGVIAVDRRGVACTATVNALMPYAIASTTGKLRADILGVRG